MAKNMNKENCKHCAGYAEIPTEHGIVRRCKVYKKLLEESHVENERPKWCQEAEKNEE